MAQNDKRQIYANFEITEAKESILGLFLGNIVLLGCILAIIDFDVLCTLWLFTSI